MKSLWGPEADEEASVAHIYVVQYTDCNWGLSIIGLYTFSGTVGLLLLFCVCVCMCVCFLYQNQCRHHRDEEGRLTRSSLCCVRCCGAESERQWPGFHQHRCGECGRLAFHGKGKLAWTVVLLVRVLKGVQHKQTFLSALHWWRASSNIIGSSDWKQKTTSSFIMNIIIYLIDFI